MSKYINPGFDEALEKAVEAPTDYGLLGAKKLPVEILVPDGDWRKYRPKFEKQRKAFDTYGCVSWANNNAEEEMHKMRYGVEVNRSDRFLAVVSNTVPGRGNSHKNVTEAKRKKGIVDEPIYPFPDTMGQKEFYRKPSQDIMTKGLVWLVDTEYGYERIARKYFREHLKCSPLQVAVDSRTNKASQVRGYDHSVIIDYIDDRGVAYVFDSYLDRFKTYEPGYPFSYAFKFYYKKLLKVKVGKYSMQLVRNIDDGKIYFVDSDGRKHWVDAPKSFTEFFGQSAWKEQKWFSLSSVEVNAFSDGEEISIKKSKFWSEIHNLFTNYGRKKD